MTTSVDATNNKGAFERRPAVFRNFVSADPNAEFPAEAGRFVLYVSYACPWACRCLAVRALKGLQDAIRVVVVDPVWAETKPGQDEHRGWHLPEGADIIFGARTIRELYEKATPADVEPTKVFSVPVFVDAVQKRIVSNESSDIIRFLNSEFNAVAANPGFDTYPEALRNGIDSENDATYNTINNGVYRCGFAKSQEAYDEAVEELFKELARVDGTLSKHRWLVPGSSHPTEADIRLFVTLIRFDEVYVVYFKTNKKCIREYAALQNWLRDMWQWDGGALQPTVNMQHIKQHYFRSHPVLNTYGVVPAGPGTLADLDAPHNRSTLPAQ